MAQAPKVRAYLKDRLMLCLSSRPQMRARDALSRVEQAALPQLPARLARPYRQYRTLCCHEIARAFQILKREGLASGGRIVLFAENWRPEDRHLKPTQYRYLLPDGPDEGGMP